CLEAARLGPEVLPAASAARSRCADRDVRAVGDLLEVEVLSRIAAVPLGVGGHVELRVGGRPDVDRAVGVADVERPGGRDGPRGVPDVSVRLEAIVHATGQGRCRSDYEGELNGLELTLGHDDSLRWGALRPRPAAGSSPASL